MDGKIPGTTETVGVTDCLRLLLVDDEPLELQALKEHIDWESMGIGEVLTAKNGRIAYELILEKEPDIVITDVNMPVMDGIALSRKIYELSRKIKVIFLSGYDEFSYVKSAIQVGAVDYLLKPFTESEIRKVMQSVRQSLELERLTAYSMESLKQRILEQLCTASESEIPALLSELSRVCDSEISQERYALLLFFGFSEKTVLDSLSQNLTGLQAVWVDQGKLAVIYQGSEESLGIGYRIQRFLRKLTGKAYSGVCLNQKKLTAQELHGGYQLLCSWESEIFYQPIGLFQGVDSELPQLSHGKLPERLMEKELKELKELEKLFPFEDETKVEAYLDQLLLLLRDQKFSREELINYFAKLLLLLGRSLPSTAVSGRELEPERAVLEACRSAEELKTLFLSRLRLVLVSWQENDGGDRNAWVVRRVKEYVRQHYSEPMTVDAIAEELHLSVNYVRTIFKEGSGQTILEYMTDYRFTKACELLRDPTLRVKDVAAMVGYENISYFGSVFTKRYHMTPNEYRKQYMAP